MQNTDTRRTRRLAQMLTISWKIAQWPSLCEFHLSVGVCVVLLVLSRFAHLHFRTMNSYYFAQLSVVHKFLCQSVGRPAALACMLPCQDRAQRHVPHLLSEVYLPSFECLDYLSIDGAMSTQYFFLFFCLHELLRARQGVCWKHTMSILGRSSVWVPELSQEWQCKG